jgi:transposase
LPGSSLFYGNWGPRIARRLARAEQTMRVRIARDELRRIRELSQTIKALQREIAGLVARIAPQLLSEPGFGPLIAAKLVGEVAGAGRFVSDAKLARAAGVAPIPVSSGKTNRHRLDRGGNRQINAAIHASPSPACAATPRRRTTSHANAPRARAPKKPSAASNATSPAASGTCSKRPIPIEEHRHHHQFLAIGAAKAGHEPR